MGKEGYLLSNRIRILRAERKMTQQDLAEKVGVSRQTIISTEKGNYTPSLLLAFEIANAFNVGINDVFQYAKKEEEL
ncbi:helix-turn-helix transcriptional regulator [Solibacillus sp. CAU 1738]|uniref:helix-turn-helix transcriptional regulator n=1 Tax=Solibacillus sp. CAU 1738 TaxID=3140363 RepID=UPI00326135DA